MLPRHKLITATALLLGALLLGAWIAGCSLRSDPFADVPTEGVTNLSSLTLSDDLIVGDDVTIGDDLTVGSILTSEDLEINGTTPYLTIGDAGEEDCGVAFDGAAQDFNISLDDSADDLVIGLGTAAGTTDVIVVDASQDVGLGGASAGAKLDVTGNVLIDGAANEVQLTVQHHPTVTTNAAFVVETSAGTDVAAIKVPPTAAASFDILDLTATTAALSGSMIVNGIDINLTGANHTGVANFVRGIDLDLTTADADATEIALDISDTDWDTGINTAANLENIGLPTIATATVITTTDGALWTIGAGEVWVVHTVFCHITTNFDCDGDDCTLHIGDGGDADGFLDLDDGELQTTDTEGTGAEAGWQGFMSTDTVGAYLTNGLPFIYADASAETIDIAVDDTGGTNPTAGAATCYLVYTRLP